MKTLKKLTMLILAVGMTASLAACDMLTGFLGGNSESEVSSENNQTSEVKEEGQMLSETEFQAAVQALYGQTNLVITITEGEQYVVGGKKIYSGKGVFADGKVYEEWTVLTNGVSTKAYTYIGTVDGVCYEWTSSDNTIWDYVEAEEAGATPRAYLEDMFLWCGFDYCQFNEKTGMMEFAGLNSPSVSVKVVNGSIVAFRFEDTNGNWCAATITYGGAVVGELPALE